MEPVEGDVISKNDIFWLEQGKEMVKGNFAAIHDAGKQLITMLTAMQGIYLAAIAYSEFAKKIGTVPTWKHIVVAMPLLIWLASLYFALQIFRTQAYDMYLNSPEHIQKLLKEIAERKQQNVQRTYWLIAIGLGTAVFNIVFYFAKIA